MNIIVNGKRSVVAGKDMSYANLLQIAGYVFLPDLSVTYRKGVNGAEGILVNGQTVLLADGMIFNVAHTGNA